MRLACPFAGRTQRGLGLGFSDSMAAVIGSIVLAFIAGNFYGKPVTDKALTLLGRSPNGTAVEWINYHAVGNEGCKRIHTDAVEGCEDMLILGDEVFMACGNSAQRAKYHPGMARYNASARTDDFKENVFKMNLKSKRVVQLEKEGYDGDTVNHGMGEWIFKNDPSKVNLFFVNHIRGQSCVTIYEHKFGTSKLKFLKNVCDEKILTPNDVAPSGPLSFYITNDHRYRTGIQRKLEDFFAPLLFHDIVYCDASGPKPKCHYAARGGMEYPNGILVIDDGAQVLVADSISGHLRRFAVDSNHNLILQEIIPTGSGLDNLSRIPGSRDVTVAGFPDHGALFKAAHDPTDGFVCPCMAHRITPAKLGSGQSSVKKVAYWDDGKVMTALTVIATDEKNDFTIGGSVTKKGLLFCDHSI